MTIPEELTEDGLLYLIIKFLEEQNLFDSAELLKEESGKFFSIEALKTKLTENKYDEANDYVLSFTRETHPEPSLAIVFYRLDKLKFLSTLNKPDELPMEVVETKLMALDFMSDDKRQEEKADLMRLAASRSVEEIREAVVVLLRLLKNQIQSSPTLQGKNKFPYLQDLSLKQLISQRNSNHNQPKTGNLFEGTSSHETEGQASTSRATFQARPLTKNSSEGTSSRKFCPPPPARVPFHPVGTNPRSSEQSSRNTWLLTTIKHSWQLQLVKLTSNERINEVYEEEQGGGIEIMFPEDLSDDDLLYLIQKFLHDLNLVRAAELVKKESQKFFSMDVMETKIKNEEWDEVEEYLSNFTEPTDPTSFLDIIIYGLDKIQFLATKNKPDNVDRLDVEWLQNELSLLDLPYDKKEKENEDLLNLDDCENVEQIEGAMDTLMTRVKKLIQNDPSIQGKYKFHHLQDLSLQQLIYQRNFNQNQQTSIQLEGTSSKASEEQASASRNPVTGNLCEGTSSHESESHLSTSSSKKRIVRLTYLNSHKGILGLLSNGYHQFWNLEGLDPVSRGKAPLTESVTNLYVEIMMNELPDACPEAVTHCFALSKDDSCLVSSSGGRISVYNPKTFERKTSLSLTTPAAATSLAFLPKCNDIVAIGKDDFTMEIHIIVTKMVRGKFEGHTKRVTGLAFSELLDSLVSSCEDAKIILWKQSVDNWVYKHTASLSIPLDMRHEALSRTEVQFHPDQIHFLVVHRTQLAIYEATTLFCTKRWLVFKSSPIHNATFSCDGQLVYCSFLDGTLRIFSNSGRVLKLICRIYPSAYIPSFSSSEQRQYPHEIAAHPRDPNQFAVGVTDEVYVFRPLPSLGKWGDPRQKLEQCTSSQQA